MRFQIRFLCSLSFTLALVAGCASAADSSTGNTPEIYAHHNTGSPTADLLAHAATANQDVYASLQSFVCSELIERYKGHAGSDDVKHLDTVSVKDLARERHRTLFRRSPKESPYPGFNDLEGAWSEGEFGTLLQQSEQLLRTQPAFIDGAAELSGVPAVMLHFDVAAADSPWDLEVGGQHYFIPFRSRIWLSEASGDILKIARTSTNIAGRTSHRSNRLERNAQPGGFERQAVVAAKHRRVPGNVP